jgi:Carboxypeptidase regulatory-like domain
MKWVWLVMLCGCAEKKAPPLDVPLAAGSARAGKVTKDSELIGGPVAYGRAGDVWKLYNAKVRFLIQDVGTSVGLDLYGGNLLDADLVREGPGNDLFRETFPIVGLHVQDPTSIEVVSDGTSGGEAHLRVHGSDAASEIIPQLDNLAQDLGGTITTDYVLAPDVPYLKITTSYQARGGQSLNTLLFGDFLSFGASLSVISPENGFTGGNTRVSFLATVGQGTSYGYVWDGGDFDVPIVDASGTATVLTSPAIPTDGSYSVTRYLVVGDGSAASVTGPMYALRGIATQHTGGVVRDAAGAPVAAARVSLFRAPYDAAATPIDQANSGDDGAYAFDVPPGDYVAVATKEGYLRGLPAAGDIVIGAGGAAEVSVDGPAKVSFLGVNVEAPDPRFGPDPTENERNGVHGLLLSADGTGKAALKPGTYDVVVSRGPEYELERSQIVVPPGGSAMVSAGLRRVVDTTGWISGDYHQHCQGSIDSPVPIADRVREDLAEGVEFPAATDHDNITDFRPAIAALHGEAWINAVAGDEVSVNGIGHFNAYPLDVSNIWPKIGVKLWAKQSIDGWVAKLRGMEPAPIVVHVSHPRTKSLAGYFNAIHFDPTTGTGMAGLAPFDAVEVNADFGTPDQYLPSADATIHTNAMKGHPDGIPTMRDWFTMLNQGKTICALGNSDTHFRNGGTGYPRNYLKLGFDDPRMATGDKLVDAISKQQVVVSNGPFVTLNAMGRGEVQTSTDIRVKVQAPSWIDTATIEVYGNGRPVGLVKNGASYVEDAAGVLQAPIDVTQNVVRLDGTITVKPARDSWYVVLVRGGGNLSPVDGSQPFAYTNPIYIDVGGDGWSAPGL